MSYYRWNGSVGSYLDPSRWNPSEVPLYGTDNSVEISAGIAILSNAQPNGISIFVSGLTAAELLLDNAAIGAQTRLSFFNNATLGIRGYNTIFASFDVVTPLLIETTGYGQLNSNGVITVKDGGVLRVGANGVLNNGGTIQFAGGSGAIDDVIAGSGRITLNVATSTLAVNAASGTDETYELRTGSLTISDVPSFRSKLAGFDGVFSSLVVRNLDFDGAQVGTGTAGATLDLLKGASVVGQIGLVDSAASGYYVVRHGDGSATIRPIGGSAQVFSDGSVPSVIEQGTVVVRNAAPNGQRIQIGNADVAAQPALVLDNASLGANLQLDFITQGQFANTAYATIGVLGYDTSEASFSLGGRFANPDIVTIALGSYAQLNQYGTISANIASSLTVQNTDPFAPGRLNNGGVIQLGGGVVRILTDVTGNGELRLTQGGGGSGGGLLELGGSVSADQRIRFDGGQLILDDPTTFHATIADFFSFGSTLILRNTVADAAALRTTGTGTILEVTRAGAVVDTINVANNLTRDGFTTSYDAVTNSTSIVTRS